MISLKGMTKIPEELYIMMLQEELAKTTVSYNDKKIICVMCSEYHPEESIGLAKTVEEALRRRGAVPIQDIDPKKNYCIDCHERLRVRAEDAEIINLPENVSASGIPLPEDGGVYSLQALQRKDIEDYPEEEDIIASQPEIPFFLDKIVEDVMRKQRRDVYAALRIRDSSPFR